jgi:hypothetical protein
MVAAATSANTVFFIAVPFQFLPNLQQVGNAKVSADSNCSRAIPEFNVHEQGELSWPSDRQQCAIAKLSVARA